MKGRIEKRREILCAARETVIGLLLRLAKTKIHCERDERIVR